MKKIVFFVITIILGIMLMVVTYQGFYMNNVQDMIESALEEKDYDALAKSFLPFYNSEETNLGQLDKNAGDEEGNADIIVYEAIVGEQITVKYKGEDTITNRYQDALVLFIDDITFNVYPVEEGDKKNNYTHVKLYNNDIATPYTYYFNDPIDVTDPNAEGVKRIYTSAAQELGFVELNIHRDDVEKELAGQVDKIEVYNGHNQLVGTKTCDFDFSSDFYKLAQEVIVAYDNYLANPENQDEANKYQEFYKEWYERYSAVETYSIAYTTKELRPTSVYLKTAGIMIAYLAIVIALGYFMLRKKPSLVEQVKSQHKTNTYRTTNMKTKQVIEQEYKIEEVVDDKEDEQPTVEQQSKELSDEEKSDVEESK